MQHVVNQSRGPELDVQRALLVRNDQDKPSGTCKRTGKSAKQSHETINQPARAVLGQKLHHCQYVGVDPKCPLHGVTIRETTKKDAVHQKKWGKKHTWAWAEPKN